MPVARVVTFDGVTKERLDEIQSGEPPEGLPAKEILVLHDPDAAQALVVLFFDTEDDYRRGGEILEAMPAGDTPGQRSSVAKYDVAFRMAV